jgi:hypothetical protein
MWFAGYTKFINPAVAHTILVSVSGTRMEDKGCGCGQTSPMGAKAEICRVPASMVLQSNAKSRIGMQLACQLWDECNDKGESTQSVRSSIARLDRPPRRDPCPDSVSPSASTLVARTATVTRLQYSRSRTVGFGRTSGTFLAQGTTNLFQHRNPIRGPSLSGP